MSCFPGLILTDRTALYYLMHSDSGARIQSNLLCVNPLDKYNLPPEQLEDFDTDHPQLGGAPIDLLVSAPRSRRKSDRFLCHSSILDLPGNSFFSLRKGLAMATPELVLLRLANQLNEYQLAQVGTNLCGRYYIDYKTDEIIERSAYLTTPDRLEKYFESIAGLRCASKVKRALRWVEANSASPEETRCHIQFNLPLHKGGFALGYDALNFDVSAGKLAALMSQCNYSIDLANTDKHLGIEYDGKDSHTEPWNDSWRRNELGVLGWRIFPITKKVLYNPHKTVQFGLQMRKVLKLRNRMPDCWHDKYLELRSSIGLPI